MNEEIKPFSLNNIINAGANGPHYGASNIYGPQIIQYLLNSDVKMLEIASDNGVLTKPFEDLIKHFLDVGARPVLNRSDIEYAFLWKESLIEISYNKKNKIAHIGWWCTDKDALAFIKQTVKDFTTKDKKNLVYSIVKTTWGLAIKALGDGSSTLIEDNYHPDVITDVNFIIESYKKSPPPSRIAILDGPPGTGKTHLIRSIFTKMDQVFLVVPSNLIASLDSPEFMPLLTDVRDSHEKPICLIIEDGDACLVPRKSDNISTIAALLNLSDGILGSIIDIKMIISTNATIKEMDAAILRPGRLCKRVTVPPLTMEQANKVYQRLMNDVSASLEKKKDYTLAEIYERFNNKDSVMTEVNGGRQAIGFRVNDGAEDSLEKRRDLTLNRIGF